MGRPSHTCSSSIASMVGRAAVLTAALGAAGCDPPIYNRSMFCSDLEEGVPPGVNAAPLAFVMFRELRSGSGVTDQPFEKVDVRISTVGSPKAGDPSEQFFVCAGDCSDPAKNPIFTDHVVVKSDEQGVAVYTIRTGVNATGYYLYSVSNQSCIQPIKR